MTQRPNEPPLRETPAEVRRWLAALPARERAELERTWTLAGLAQRAELSREGTERAWSRFETALDEGTPVEKGASARRQTGADRPSRPSKAARLRRSGLPIAVAALALAGAGLAVWMWPQTLTAPRGATVAADLPDGSDVVLSGGSTLRYRRGLRGRVREATLDGEAFFDVAAEGRPFVVETFNAEVEVLGTSFNVRARSGDLQPATVVAVASGAVGVEAKGVPERAVRLAPHQMSRVAGGAEAPTAPAAVDLEAALAWRSGGLFFSGEPLGNVLDELERRLAVEIQAPLALRRRPLSVYWPHVEGAEAVLADVSRYRGYRYEATPDGYRLVEGTEAP